MAGSPGPRHVDLNRGDAVAIRRRRIVAVAGLLLGAVAIWLIVYAVNDATSPEGFSGAEVEEIEIDSAAVGRRLAVEIVVPQDLEEGEQRPLLVFLHGSGSSPESNLNEAMFDALAAQGERAPVVAMPAGEESFWHDRADGDWGKWVTDEVLPAVERTAPVDGERVAIGGISMGGFGALDLARLNRGEFCAVGGHSAAIWQSAGETAPGAFDDAEAFEAHDLIDAAAADPGPFLEQPVWLDSGDVDPFRPGIEAFAAQLEAAGAELRLEISPGGHESSYWQRHWSDYMRFYARALAEC